mgnify:CR=1 FL=1
MIEFQEDSHLLGDPALVVPVREVVALVEEPDRARAARSDRREADAVRRLGRREELRALVLVRATRDLEQEVVVEASDGDEPVVDERSVLGLRLVVLLVIVSGLRAATF